jgi:L-ascorbate metabolism protein UlaG (beta-lactamase superfamily)
MQSSRITRTQRFTRRSSSAVGLSTCLLSVGLAVGLSLGWAMQAAEKTLTGDRVPTSDGDLIIHPINHATLALGWKDLVIYVDPVGGARRFADLPPPNLILVTDIHGDHFSAETLQAVAGEKAALVVPPAVAEQLPARLRPRAVVLANGQSNQVAGVPVEAIAAYNLTPERTKFHPKGRGNGYVLTLGNRRVYISGDTEGVPEMLALRDITVAFVCMNLPYTMTAAQAAEAVRAFRPKIVYPYHCRGTNLEEFKKLVGEQAGIEVRIRDWYRP